jgi:hypothetical protein
MILSLISPKCLYVNQLKLDVHLQVASHAHLCLRPQQPLPAIYYDRVLTSKQFSHVVV